MVTPNWQELLLKYASYDNLIVPLQAMYYGKHIFQRVDVLSQVDSAARTTKLPKSDFLKSLTHQTCHRYLYSSIKIS
jgi:hypothetical protein